MTAKSTGEWVRLNWPILCGVAGLIVVFAELVFQLGSIETQFDHTVAQAAEHQSEMSEAHTALKTRIDEHENRPSHEHTAIRLERMETNQNIMQRDLKRVQTQLDTISTDIRRTLRRVPR